MRLWTSTTSFDLTYVTEKTCTHLSLVIPRPRRIHSNAYNMKQRHLHHTVFRFCFVFFVRLTFWDNTAKHRPTKIPTKMSLLYIHLHARARRVPPHSMRFRVTAGR